MSGTIPAVEVAAELYDKAKALVILKQQVSVRILQINFLLRAGAALRLIEELEKNGVISQPDESGVRTLMPQYRASPI